MPMLVDDDLVDRLWRSHEAHCGLALEAEEKGWPDAYAYHKARAREYLDLINVIVKQREDTEDARLG